MARSVPAPSNAHIASHPPEVAHDAAAAAVDAEVQTHHRLLLCLEQSRRAQLQMVHDCMRDMLGTARTLSTSTDQVQWLQASTALAWGLCARGLSAQATMSAAWSEFQRSVLDQARTSGEVAQAGNWPLASAQPTTPGRPSAEGADPQWLTQAMRTCEKLATAWTSAWMPGSLQTETPR